MREKTIAVPGIEFFAAGEPLDRLPARPAQALPSCAAAGQQRRSSRMRIAFHTRSVLGLLGICFVLLCGAQAQAAVTITNKRGVLDTDEPNYYIRDGIVIIPKNSVIAAGAKI